MVIRSRIRTRVFRFRWLSDGVNCRETYTTLSATPGAVATHGNGWNSCPLLVTSASCFTVVLWFVRSFIFEIIMDIEEIYDAQDTGPGFVGIRFCQEW